MTETPPQIGIVRSECPICDSPLNFKDDDFRRAVLIKTVWRARVKCPACQKRFHIQCKIRDGKIHFSAGKRRHLDGDIHEDPVHR